MRWRALAAAVAVLTACPERRREEPALPAGPLAEPSPPRPDAWRARNNALQHVTDRLPIDKGCPVEGAASLPLFRLGVADLARAGAGVDPAARYESVAVIEVDEPGFAIVRVFIFDREQQKLVCGGGAQGRTPDDAIAGTKLFELADRAVALAVDAGPEEPLGPRVGPEVRQVGIGQFHFCALLADGRVSCWGHNTSHQIPGAKGGVVPAPVFVPKLTGATALTVRDGHACVLNKAGAVRCWGGNTYGEAGGVSDDPVVAPRAISGLPPATAIAAGSSFTCALSGGNVFCWGQRFNASPMDDSVTPTAVKTPGVGKAVELCAGDYYACEREATGEVRCWGTFGTRFPLPQIATPTKVEVGDAAALACLAGPCAIQTDGGLTCLDPQHALMPGAAVAQIASDSDHACAIDPAGVLRCCGENEWGSVGDGTKVERPCTAPATPTGLSHAKVKQVAIGNQRAAAILENGELRTWGYGPIGDGRECNGPPCDGLVPTRPRW